MDCTLTPGMHTWPNANNHFNMVHSYPMFTQYPRRKLSFVVGMVSLLFGVTSGVWKREWTGVAQMSCCPRVSVLHTPRVHQLPLSGTSFYCSWMFVSTLLPV